MSEYGEWSKFACCLWHVFKDLVFFIFTKVGEYRHHGHARSCRSARTKIWVKLVFFRASGPPKRGLGPQNWGLWPSKLKIVLLFFAFKSKSVYVFKSRSNARISSGHCACSVCTLSSWKQSERHPAPHCFRKKLIIFSTLGILKIHIM